MDRSRIIAVVVVVAIMVVILAAIFLANAAGPPNVAAPEGQKIESLNGIEVGDR